MSVATGFLGIAVLLILLALQVPVAISLILVSFGGVYLMIGIEPAIGILTSTPYEFIASWTLSAVPMFLLMGYVAFHSGLTGSLFDAAKLVFRRIPGGLGISSIFACTGFASVSGSSLATAAAMGRIAIPEMIKAGYKPSFASGILAAGGTIGALIPPSILMIIFGVFTETSVLKVFMGGISIGILTAVAYSLLVLGVARFRPDIIPPVTQGIDDLNGRDVLIQIWPLLALITIIFGGMFSGIFTATEAGAVGAMGAIVISALSGRLNWQQLYQSVLETLSTTASLFIIGVGAVMFTKFVGLSGVGGAINNLMIGMELNYYQLLFVIVILYLILGMFLEPFGAMLITLPILLPLLQAEGISIVWFGVFLVKLLEVGMITPPLGMNVFIIKNVASKYVSLGDVFKGVMPFIIVDMFLVALIIVFPDIVLYLPNKL
ncbi:MAG: TRAP transporter large permease subunit [Alphaproteobacteria bacterium]|nr:TRAP transporter large permease subunit [Alphaproteobacteria bacterium]